MGNALAHKLNSQRLKVKTMSKSRFFGVVLLSATLSGCAGVVTEYNWGEPTPEWYNATKMCPFAPPFERDCGRLAVFREKGYRIIGIISGAPHGALRVIMRNERGEVEVITRTPIK